MGTTLTGTTPQDTYDSLIKVTDNGPISGTLKALSDGLGNDSTLSLSTTAASIAGTLAVTGNATFDTNTLFVDAANNRVGIGTATPANTLDVAGAGRFLLTSTTTPAIRLDYNASSQYGEHLMNGNGDYVISTPATNGVTSGCFGLSLGGTFAMRIIANRNVGIGTDSPANVLDLGSAPAGRALTWANSNSLFSSYSAAGLVLSSNFYGSTSTDTYLTSNTATFGAAGIRVGANDGAGNSGLIRFFADPAAAKTAGAAFTPTERVRIDPDGLKFNGDTAAANALDDYEEGTWTMGISFGNASVGVTYTTNSGTYTKIGRQVTAVGYISMSNKGSSTGTARITGLPFTIANAASFYAPPTFGQMNQITSLGQITGYGEINATTILLLQTTLAGGLTTLANTDFANTSEIMVSFTYFV
jgi:hypothetical protein